MSQLTEQESSNPQGCTRATRGKSHCKQATRGRLHNIYGCLYLHPGPRPN